MSDQELRDELMTLLVAGHETTATALSWAVERLVRHPARARAAARRGARRRRASTLDAVAKETLRLRPVLPIVVRRLTEPMEIGGYELPGRRDRSRPASTSCTAARTSTPSRARFRPERFLEQPAGTYTWIPFGGGVRRCLGASFALFEMKVGAAARSSRRRGCARRGAAPERIARRAITLAPEPRRRGAWPPGAAARARWDAAPPDGAPPQGDARPTRARA